MQVMGTNTWEFDAPRELLVKAALEFAEGVKVQGVAVLRDACIARDRNVMWCTWDTDNLEGLQEAFDEMNRETGLTSKLTTVDIMFPTDTRT